MAARMVRVLVTDPIACKASISMDVMASSAALQRPLQSPQSSSVVRGRQKRSSVMARPKLTNFRLSERLLDDLEELRSALGRATLVEIVRDALEDYVTKHADVIKAVKKAREKHSDE
jgi:predicted DNA-binding protein